MIKSITIRTVWTSTLLITSLVLGGCGSSSSSGSSQHTSTKIEEKYLTYEEKTQTLIDMGYKIFPDEKEPTFWSTSTTGLTHYRFKNFKEDCVVLRKKKDGSGVLNCKENASFRALTTLEKVEEDESNAIHSE